MFDLLAQNLYQAHWLHSINDIFLQSNDFMSELFSKQYLLRAIAAEEEEVIHMGLVVNRVSDELRVEKFFFFLFSFQSS